MLRHEPGKNEDDGSKRLLLLGIRAVEHGLSDESAIATIRKYAAAYPFPTNWRDDQILQRLRDAEARNDVVRGSAHREIDTSIRDLSVITPLAWKALELANEPATLFRYGGIPSRIEWADEGGPTVKALDNNRMRYHLARSADWIRWTKTNGRHVARKVEPPQMVVSDVLATPDQPLPVLSRIVESPVFGADGTLHSEPGYNPASRAYYASAKGFLVPDISEHPSKKEVADAVLLIGEELLGDFPFVSDSEKSHAIALLLLPFARGLIDGPTPLHLFEKPSPGTGATLLVDMLTFPSIGRAIPTMTEGRDEDEWRKRITSKLLGGSQFIMIDNLRRCLDSAAVAAGLTATIWEDRILGKSAIVQLPVQCAWMATGNNPTVSTEISRRTIRIKMDAKVDRPWQRTEFRHPNLRQWATENRPRLVWSALTLIQAWIDAGRPEGGVTLGMYERWAAVIGGILKVAGIAGFLENAANFYDEADAEGEIWRTFMGVWWERFKNEPTSQKDLWQIVNEEVCLPLGAGTEQSQKVVLSNKLKEQRDRIFDLGDSPGKLLLQRGKNKKQNAYRWHLSLAV